MKVINDPSVRVTKFCRSRVKNRSRRRHHQLSIKKTGSNIIHATVHPLDRIPNRNNNQFFSLSNILATRYHRNLLEKNSNLSQNSLELNTNPKCPTTLNQNKSTTTILTDVSSQQNNYLLRNTNNQIKIKNWEKISTDIHQRDIVTNAWSDQKGVSTDHHFKAKQKKKKKKFSRLCIFISVFVAFLLSIAIITIPIVLLVKSKTTPKTATLRWNSTGVTIAGITDQYGVTSNLLHSPFGLTFNFNNTLYIADYQNNRIQMYLPSASIGTTVAGFSNGIQVTNSSGFAYPADVVVDSDGNIYVADSYNSRVQFWSNGASYGTTIAGSGVAGSLLNQLNLPYSIARDSNSGALYIADSQNHRIMVYAFNASTGNIFAGYQGPGTNGTQLYFPVGLYLDSSSNSLIIANNLAHNIVRWELNASNWTLVAGSINGSYGNTSTLLFYPYDVIVDPMGNVYVADTGNQRIQFYPTGQSYGVTIAGVTSVSGNSSTLFNSPASLALDSQLNLYVSDLANQRIQKFSRY